jgi:hypothetical protein
MRRCRFGLQRHLPPPPPPCFRRLTTPTSASCALPYPRVRPVAQPTQPALRSASGQAQMSSEPSGAPKRSGCPACPGPSFLPLCAAGRLQSAGPSAGRHSQTALWGLPVSMTRAPLCQCQRLRPLLPPHPLHQQRPSPSRSPHGSRSRHGRIALLSLEARVSSDGYSTGALSRSLHAGLP